MPSANYPSSVAEILDDRMTFRPDALRAVKRFARSKPWRGTVEERKAKFRRLNRDLARAYGIARPRLIFSQVQENPEVGNGWYQPSAHTIALVGKLSVVTYLHEFGHARGYDERKACRFSVNLFRRVFPRSFARCRPMGHVLVRG
jgi:hypothetical protein